MLDSLGSLWLQCPILRGQLLVKYWFDRLHSATCTAPFDAGAAFITRSSRVGSSGSSFLIRSSGNNAEAA